MCVKQTNKKTEVIIFLKSGDWMGVGRLSVITVFSWVSETLFQNQNSFQLISCWSLKPVVQHQDHFTPGTKLIIWRKFKHQNTCFLPHSPQVLLFKCLIALTHRTRTITNSSYVCITDCSLPSFVISVHVIESIESEISSRFVLFFSSTLFKTK